ncbi:Xanthan lyase [Balamuthia mandrillaris]
MFVRERLQLLMVLLLFLLAASEVRAEEEWDVVVYGATPAGISAALAAVEANSRVGVLLMEPTREIGGMVTAGGIGMRDFRVEQRLTGKLLQWAMTNAAHYGVSYPVWQPDNWVGNRTFWSMLEAAGIPVVLGARIQEGPAGVQVSGSRQVVGGRRISRLRTVDGRGFALSRNAVVVDASYEGEVMMGAGVSYTWGREDRTTYNESYGGIIGSSAAQFKLAVDAQWANGTLLHYVTKGPDPRTHVGQADRNVMAYSYRVCLTTNRTNQAPFTPPPAYRTADFEIARRYLQEELKAFGENGVEQPWGNLRYRSYPPANKFDACCGNASVGIDPPGLAAGYPNGTLTDRQRIAAAHRYYVQGLLWFWAGDPHSGVPDSLRNAILQYGLCADEWPQNDHWPPQLYVREAVRMLGQHVFSQNDRVAASCDYCRPESIALGDWGFDIHEMERVAVPSNYTASKTQAYNEGLTPPGQGGFFVFEIPYAVLTPKQTDCVNLLVPNCPSVSHVAFAAIREEPTLWQLGAASGIAATLVASNMFPTVQSVKPSVVAALLQKQGIVTHWPSRPDCSCY